MIRGCHELNEVRTFRATSQSCVGLRLLPIYILPSSASDLKGKEF
jgi:hypothetical protein